MIDWPAEQRKVAARLLAAGLINDRQCKKPWFWHGATRSPPFMFESVVVPAAGDAPERTFKASEIP